MFRRPTTLLVLFTLSACSSSSKPGSAQNGADDAPATEQQDSAATNEVGDSAEPDQPQPFVAPTIWGVTALEDLDPAEDVVEVELTAALGEVDWVDSGPTEVWAYNGLVPGPLIQAKVGDLVRIRFTNELDSATTIHWHGLRIPDEMDGVPAIQDPVESGESFTYEFRVPDAGTFWYHPHVRTHVAVERGLQGMLVVHSPDDPPLRERAFVVDDVLLSGSSIDRSTMDHMSQMHGRHGNTLLTNGSTALLEDRMAAAQAERWRIVNTANARTMWVRATGARWRVVAVDGQVLDTPFETTRGLLPVGQRLDLEVIPELGATEVGLQVELPSGSGGWSEYPVFSAAVEGEPAEGSWTEWTAPAVPAVEEAVQEAELLLNSASGTTTIEWTINGEVYGEHTPLELQANTPTVITVRDRSRAEHPFHLHGQFFQVLDRNGEVVPEDAGQRDTVLVEGRDTLRLYTNLDNPGLWMAHCHILEHAELGMMTELIVTE